MLQRATMCALFALLCFAGGANALADATKQAVLPQARPFVDFLEAVKAGDADKFRDCQSNATRESKQPWAKKLEEAKRSLSRRFGDYEISRFTYGFAGEETRGDLTVTYPGHEPMKLKVVKEGDEWKLASH